MEVLMLKNEKIEDAKKWKLLIEQYESRKISCEAFFELHNVSRGNLYKWRRHYLTKNSDIKKESFICLEVDPSQGFKPLEDLKINSPIKISNKLGVTVECVVGCKYSELKAIIEVLNATE
jgi:hypothetical protein